MKIKQSVIVTYNAQQMFSLVSAIDKYPQYLPWCSNSTVKIIDDNTVDGTIYIEYLGIKMHFATRNVNTPNSQIKMHLLDGPFKHLNGVWQFKPLGDKGCKIDFELDYQFSSLIVAKVLEPLFKYIIHNIIDCFIKQADKQYADKN